MLLTCAPGIPGKGEEVIISVNRSDEVLELNPVSSAAHSVCLLLNEFKFKYACILATTKRDKILKMAQENIFGERGGGRIDLLQKLSDIASNLIYFLGMTENYWKIQKITPQIVFPTYFLILRRQHIEKKTGQKIYYHYEV